MKHGYSVNSLLRFIYGETSVTKSLETEFAIKEDEEVARTYHDLKSAYNLLPKVLFYPARATIDNILNYSRNGQMEATC